MRSTRNDAVRLVVLALAFVMAACSGPDASRTATPSRASATNTPTVRASPTPSATPTATPTATPSSTPPAAGAYLALGDSLAVGVGATRPGETGYVARLHAALAAPGSAPLTTVLHNLAVSGETSTSMIRTGQLASAINLVATAEPGIALVTLDIGGNDLLRLLGTSECASAPQDPPCLQLLALTLADFEANYRLILEQLTDALEAHAPDARLAVMTYFNPFSGTDAAYESASELALLGADGGLDCEADGGAAHGMNDIIACVGEEHGALVADVHPEFDRLGLELTHIAAQDIHANDRGYEVIANQFLEVLGD